MQFLPAIFGRDNIMKSGRARVTLTIDNPGIGNYMSNRDRSVIISALQRRNANG